MHDDLTKFDSDPTSPPRLVDIPEEGKGKGKELSVFKPVDLHRRYPQQGRRWGSP
jgi:hypothetical protein